MTVKDNEREIQHIKNSLDKLAHIVIGNGDEGMDEELRSVRRDQELMKSDIAEIKDTVNKMKPLISDFSAMKKAVFDKLELNALGEKKQPNWFVDKVLPGLLQAILVAIGTAFFVLVVLHFQELTG